MDKANRTPHLQLVAGGKPDGCQHVEALLAAWADDALSGDEARQVADHVRICRACAAEARSLRETIAALRDGEDLAAPQTSPALWAELEAKILHEVDQLPSTRPWWRRPAARWGGLVALAAALVAVVAVPAAHWLDIAPTEAEQVVDAHAVFGSASEVVASDRAFVDDLAATDDDPLNTVDELDDLDDVDLDALGTALDDDSPAGQGA